VTRPSTHPYPLGQRLSDDLDRLQEAMIRHERNFDRLGQLATTRAPTDPRWELVLDEVYRLRAELDQDWAKCQEMRDRFQAAKGTGR
jgi:hypothetical protein